MKAIVNANVVTELGIIWDGAILVEDGKISKVDKKMNVEIPKDAEIIDADGKYVGRNGGVYNSWAEANSN